MKLRADRRVMRQEEAIERNAQWTALPTSTKIASLRERRGFSKRQLGKLEKSHA